LIPAVKSLFSTPVSGQVSMSETDMEDKIQH